ncbi:NUDIX domain-containing protein [Desulforamulus aeronauticus]|uniref:8-oxo-dGTP diphosphatase n=1 Tax=Desulforamulus aeronauticus DSM 10349 TaxID=1121421 RepID=A0A1M6NXB7_9FIRM|nr:NUDIX domain-containing protein [Desulforamulus aeronauticus]SHK00389.1 8-oxo-dGTP diphosphatase [Desulforamulus aeronauticus DSM 10349]
MQNALAQNIKFSIRVMIENNLGQVLLGLKRKGYHANHWIFPGGQLDYGESVSQCGCREVWEETALKVEVVGLLGIVAETTANKHVVFINLLARGEGNPVLTEPHEMIEWKWVDINQLPANITVSVQSAIDKYQSGQPVISV